MFAVALSWISFLGNNKGLRFMAKRIFMASALFAVPLVGLLVVRQLKVPSPGVTQANFQRLHKGMSEKEVEWIMGCPGESFMKNSFSHYTCWTGPGCTVFIRFGDLGAENGQIGINGGTEMELRERPDLPPWLAFFFKQEKIRE